jgi:hypothetical protein
MALDLSLILNITSLPREYRAISIVKVKSFTNSNKNMFQKVYLNGNLGYSKALIKLENIFSKGGCILRLSQELRLKKATG